MAKRLVEESSLIAVADAIRSKGGTSGELNFPSGFQDAIAAIPTEGEGIVPTGTIDITENGTHDVTNYASANVNVPVQSENGGIVPSGTIAITENGTYDVTNYANANVAFPEIERAVPVISVDSNGLITANVMQEAGVVSEGTETATKQLSTQAGKTIKPGASDIIAVEAGKYTTGDIIVEGIDGSSDASDTDIEVGSLSELHAWSKYTIGGSIIEEQMTDVQLFWKMTSSSTTFEIDYADSYEIINNGISLVNPTTITLGSDTESRNTIKGKYVKRGDVYYIPTDARVAYGNYTNSKTIEVDKATKITYTAADGEFVSIVVSEDSSAYPQNGEQDGYKYVYNGTLDDTASEPALQSKSVTPSETAQTVAPDSGYDGLSSVAVAGDADLVASNIKKGVEIFGVVGSYESGVELPTLTTPGTADDLASGKQFIDADGNVITGTVPVVTILTTTQGDTFVSFDAEGKQITMSDKLGERKIVDGNASVLMTAPASEFGDASAADVAKGKTFTSADGLKVTGTVETYDAQVGWKNRTPTLDGDSAVKLSIATDVPYLLRKGVFMSSPLSNFGDATAADVAKGKTFTSAAGLTVVGTNTFRDIKTITIEEV